MDGLKILVVDDEARMRKLVKDFLVNKGFSVIEAANGEEEMCIRDRSLPGGWVDVNVSVKENFIKEVREEAGLDVTVDTVVAVQDREKHNLPIYAYKVCKIFAVCTVTGGEFKPNAETTESRYFGLDELPLLAEEKNNEEQIRMCFEAYGTENWKTLID